MWGPPEDHKSTTVVRQSSPKCKGCKQDDVPNDPESLRMSQSVAATSAAAAGNPFHPVTTPSCQTARDPLCMGLVS